MQWRVCVRFQQSLLHSSTSLPLSPTSLYYLYATQVFISRHQSCLVCTAIEYLDHGLHGIFILFSISHPLFPLLLSRCLISSSSSSFSPPLPLLTHPLLFIFLLFTFIFFLHFFTVGTVIAVLLAVFLRQTFFPFLMLGREKCSGFLLDFDILWVQFRNYKMFMLSEYWVHEYFTFFQQSKK